jgi:hypothetical protein
MEQSLLEKQVVAQLDTFPAYCVYKSPPLTGSSPTLDESSPNPHTS